MAAGTVSALVVVGVVAVVVVVVAVVQVRLDECEKRTASRRGGGGGLGPAGRNGRRCSLANHPASIARPCRLLGRGGCLGGSLLFCLVLSCGGN